MLPMEFVSSVAKTTGKFVNIARVRKLFKLYSPLAIEQSLIKLKEHNAPHTIPDPVSFIQRILAVDQNKENANKLFDELKFGNLND